MSIYVFFHLCGRRVGCSSTKKESVWREMPGTPGGHPRGIGDAEDRKKNAKYKFRTNFDFGDFYNSFIKFGFMGVLRTDFALLIAL